MTEQEAIGIKGFLRKLAIAVIAGLVLQTTGFLVMAGYTLQTVEANERRSIENRDEIQAVKNWLRPVPDEPQSE